MICHINSNSDRNKKFIIIQFETFMGPPLYLQSRIIMSVGAGINYKCLRAEKPE